jgi:hypothetical protein
MLSQIVDNAISQGHDPIMFSPDDTLSDAAIDLLAMARGKRFGTILADPPWQFRDFEPFTRSHSGDRLPT